MDKHFSFFRSGRRFYIGISSEYRAIVKRLDVSGRVSVTVHGRLVRIAHDHSFCPCVFHDTASSIQSGKKKANEFLSGAAK
jgi:hypothetical protein